MALDYQDFSGPNASQDNIGGGTTRIFGAPVSYFTPLTGIKDWKALTDGTATALSEFATISTTHTFNTGYGFHTFYCTMDKGSIEWTPQGELDGRSFKGMAKGFMPGVDASWLGLMRQAKNDRWIFLFELADGQLMQLGSKRFPAYFLPEKIGSATNSSGIRGTEYSITTMESGPAMYTGTVTLFP